MLNLDAYGHGSARISYIRESPDNPETEILDQGVSIDEYLNFCEIRSSLNQAFRVGILSIYDSDSFRDAVGFVGNDIISISYTNNQLDSSTDYNERKEVTFRIINIEEVAESSSDPGLANKRRTINLTLAEHPLFDLYLGNQIYKTYEWSGGDENNAPEKELTISGIVQDLLSEELSPNLLNGWQYRTDIQETSDISDTSLRWNFYIPRWTLLKTVNYLKKFAISNEGNYPNYIFTSRDIVNTRLITFKSIYSIINDINAINASEEYGLRSNIQALPLNPSKMNPAWASNAILNFKYNIYNGFDIAFGGLSGKTYLHHDYFKGVIAHSNSFDNYKKQYKIGLDAYYIYANSFGDQFSNIFYTGEDHNQSLMLNDYAKKSLRSITCTVNCYLNPFRYVGQHAKLSIPSVSPVNGGGAIDSINDGNWIIWTITDKINKDGTAWSTVEFAKDSVFVQSLAVGNLETAS